MKFSVLALDFDGTIAKDDRPDHNVLMAIDIARTRGIAVILVTGRTLRHLRRDMADLSRFDAVVAENGAVLEFPSVGKRILTRPPNPKLIKELRDTGIQFSVGDCIFDADASSAPAILKAIKKLGLPVSLIFNHNRVMALPQGVTKATGLREALNTLRLSLHNCLGIGDGENDYQMLDSCEVGVAVSWGSKSLLEIADDVIQGDGPAAIAKYLERVLESTRLPLNLKDRRRILLGQTTDGQDLEVAVHGRTVLIAGDPRSGKSWVAGLVCEQLILHGYSVCVIDPEGDYTPLEALPGVVVFGGDEPPPRLTELANALRYPDLSAVLDLSRLNHEKKVRYLRQALPMIAELRRTSGQPHWILVDEAHYFLDRPEHRSMVDTDLGAYLLITYRVSNLPTNLLQTVETVIVTQITDPREASRLSSMFDQSQYEVEWNTVLKNLGIKEAALLPNVGAPQGGLKKFVVAGRLTPHVRHRSKYLEVPMAEWHGFVFTRDGEPVGKPALTLKEFVSMLGQVPAAVLEGHARRGDFSRWVGGVLGDQPLAREVQKVEKAFARGKIPLLCESLVEPVRERYELTGVHFPARLCQPQRDVPQPGGSNIYESKTIKEDGRSGTRNQSTA